MGEVIPGQWRQEAGGNSAVVASAKKAQLTTVSLLKLIGRGMPGTFIRRALAICRGVQGCCTTALISS